MRCGSPGGSLVSLEKALKSPCEGVFVEVSYSADKPKTFSIHALGCRTNQYEAEAIKSQLRELGMHTAEGKECADICIVNTCTVTDGADASSRHAIREMRRSHPHAKIVVTGCMAEKGREALLQIDPCLMVISNQDKEDLVASLFPEEGAPEYRITQFEGHTRAFVKVQDGCNSFCSYCVIPYVRGRSRSRPVEAIVREVEGLIASGYKEIVLTGINLGDFCLPDGKRGLGTLVRAVDSLSGLHRLRLSSIDPNDVDEDLFEACVYGRHTCPSMHIVLQSGSNVILKRMNRTYSRYQFLDTVRRFKEARSDFTFTTDVIVGFPQETESDFQETLDMVRSIQFAKVHIFPYSDRPRTKASFMPNKVPSEEIKRRRELLFEVSKKEAFSLRERFVGKNLTILTERSDGREGTCGHTEHFLEVFVPGCERAANECMKVAIIGNSMEGLIGQCLDQ